jgi:hypothetical protein
MAAASRFWLILHPALIMLARAYATMEGSLVDEPSLECTAPIDPTTESLSRVEQHLVRGDFQAAGAQLEQELASAVPEAQPTLRAARHRLQVDGVALLAAAACGVALLLLASLTLFH